MKLFKNIDETLYTFKHKSGLEVFVIPKKGYSKKYATFATHYGSINNRFIVPGENTVTNVPDGVAHFLEHKLFDQEDGNVMDQFSKLGTQPNAFTSFDQTVYLFSCTDKFKENFDLLLDFVQKPYFTDKSVENEKGIIGQEIKMYEDDPNWRVFFNLLGALYKNHPVRLDIAGSIESISEIDKDILYKCYNTFYHPSNMIIVVAGDVDPKEVFDQVEANILINESKPKIERLFDQEPESVNNSYVEQALQVSESLFQLGFKDSIKEEGFNMVFREIAIRCLLEMLAGRSSQLYERLYDQGLINDTFDFDYTIEENYAYTIFGGESKNPIKVKDEILKEIDLFKKSDLDISKFERVRKSLKGRELRQLNSVDKIARIVTAMHFRGINWFDTFEVYDKLDYDYVKQVFHEHFVPERMALSVIKPV